MITVLEPSAPPIDAAPLTVLSVGAGQDSTALLYLIGLNPAFRAKYAPGHVLCIFSDTGDEHDDTYAHLPTLKAFCAEHNMEFVHLKPEMGFHLASWPSLSEFYDRYKTIGSQAYPKSCTDSLKIAPFYAFLATYLERWFGGKAKRKNSFYHYANLYGKLEVIIGFAAGEDRIAPDDAPCNACKGSGLGFADPCAKCGGTGIAAARHKWFKDCVRRTHPLAEAGLNWNRQDCQNFIRSIHKPVPPPSNCYQCPFKSPDEILWSWFVDPVRFARWEKRELTKLAANRHKEHVVNKRTGKIENKNFGVYKNKLLG